MISSPGTALQSCEPDSRRNVEMLLLLLKKKLVDNYKASTRPGRLTVMGNGIGHR